MTQSEKQLNQLINQLAAAGHQEIQVYKLPRQNARRNQLLGKRQST